MGVCLSRNFADNADDYVSSSSSSSSSTSKRHQNSHSKPNPTQIIEQRLATALKLLSLDLSNIPSLSTFPDILALSSSTSPTSNKLLLLKQIDLSDTKISSIPTDIDKFTKLNRLVVNRAALCTPLPLSLTALANLTHLSLANNNLTAKDFQNLTSFPMSLRELYLQNNPKLGTIPHATTNALLSSSLQILDLSNCGLTGRLNFNVEMAHDTTSSSTTTTTTTLSSSSSIESSPLIELRLDDNSLTSVHLLQEETPPPHHPHITTFGWNHFPHLQVLTLRNNQLQPTPQSFPADLFVSTRLATLELKGNKQLTVVAMLNLPGFDAFAGRRAAKINKGIQGDVVLNQDRSMCGLDGSEKSKTTRRDVFVNAMS